MGLVKQCLTSLYKKNIQRLTKVRTNSYVYMYMYVYIFLIFNQKFKIELYFKFVSLKKNLFFLHLKVGQSHQVHVL